ncbi:MAG: hypothetical protein P0S96_07740 [Simkaniaceae bacterium]|nr:hypothetical protein [Candidatus Sacchlamyda saccharinae]
MTSAKWGAVHKWFKKVEELESKSRSFCKEEIIDEWLADNYPEVKGWAMLGIIKHAPDGLREHLFSREIRKLFSRDAPSKVKNSK